MTNDNPILYSDLVKPDNSIVDLIKQLKELQNEYSKTLESVKSEAITVKAALSGLSGATAENREQIKKSVGEVDRLSKAQKELAFAESETAKEIAKLKLAQNEANTLNKLQVRLNQSAEGSYNRLSAQYSINKIRLNNMSKAEREATKEGKQLEQQTANIFEEMKKMQVVVNDYKNDILGASKEQNRLKDELLKTQLNFKNQPLIIKNNIDALSQYENKINNIIKDINALGQVTGKTYHNIQDVEFEKDLLLSKKNKDKIQETDNNRLSKLQIKLNSSLEGSYDKLSAQYSINKILLNKMSSEERNSTESGQLLEQQTREIYEEMKRLQEATGKYSLNVGNYKNDILGAFKEQERLKNELIKTKREFESQPSVIKKNKDAISQYDTKVEELKKDINALGQVTGKTYDNIQDVEFEEVLTSYNENLKEALGLNNQFGNSLLNLAQSGQGMNGLFTSLGNGAKALGQTLFVLLANPVFLAIAGIAGVGAAFKFWYDYNQGLTEATRLTQQFSNKSGDDLKQFRNEVQSVADTFNKDFKETLISANAVAKQFGISQDESLKLIEKGFIAGADANGEFLQNLKEYPAYFKEAGISASEFIAITTQTNKLGIYSDKGIDTIKEGNIRIREMTKATSDALKGIGINATQVQKDLQNGSKTTFDVMQEVSTKLNELPESSAAVGTAIADIFGGPGEDAGLQYLKTLKDIDTNLDNVKKNAGELGALQEEQLRSQAELNNVIAGLFDATGGSFESLTTNARIFLNDILIKLITGVIDLTNYFIKLYNDSILFRSLIGGLAIAWDTLYSVVKSVFTFIIEQGKVAGDIVHGIFTLDFAEIKNAYAQWGKNTVNIFRNIGKGTAKAFNDGFKGMLDKVKPIQIPTTVLGSSTTTKTGGSGGKTHPKITTPLTRKEIEDIRKKNLDLQRKYEDAQTELIADEFDKRRKKVLIEYDRQKTDLEYQLKTDKQLNEEGRNAINGSILLLEEKKTKDLSDIENERELQLLNIQKQGLELRLSTAKKGSEQELNLRNELIEKERQIALAENNKKPITQKQDPSSINARFDLLVKNSKDEYAQLSLLQFDNQQKLAQSEFDLLKKTEAEKTRFKLEQEKARLQKILEVNSKLNNQLSKNEIDTIKNTIKQIDSEISLLAQQPKDIYEMLGIKLNEPQKQAISESTNFALSNLKSILDANVQLADVAIQKSQSEVEATKSRLDQEIEARNNGYANNVMLAQKENELAKKQLEQANKDKEKAVKKQQLLDTITQTSSLITASANIWASLSAIPIVGVGLAVAALATMWGSFAAAKIKAGEVTKESYGDGTVELLQGGSHQSGSDIDLGTKPDGTKRRAEGGEFFAVINKRNSKRYRHVIPDVINSLNSGSFAEKYLKSYRTDSVNLNLKNESIDMKDISDDVKEIKNQNRKKIYSSNGKTVERYKNLTRTYK